MGTQSTKEEEEGRASSVFDQKVVFHFLHFVAVWLAAHPCQYQVACSTPGSHQEQPHNLVQFPEKPKRLRHASHHGTIQLPACCAPPADAVLTNGQNPAADDQGCLVTSVDGQAVPVSLTLATPELAGNLPL